jgi:hypothetical protein
LDDWLTDCQREMETQKNVTQEGRQTTAEHNQKNADAQRTKKEPKAYHSAGRDANQEGSAMRVVIWSSSADDGDGGGCKRKRDAQGKKGKAALLIDVDGLRLRLR